MLTGHSFIGQNRSKKSSRTFRAVAPAAGTTLEPEFFCAEASDVELAAKLAWEAFEQYSRREGPVREQLLQAIAAGLEGMADVLIARAHEETALPLPRLKGELGRTCMQLRFQGAIAAAGGWQDIRLDPADPNRQPLPKPEVRCCLRPVGPVAVFGASNFPLAFSVAGGDTASALASGCTVIVKAHPAHPGTSEMAATAIQSAVRSLGLPEGVFSMLFDDSHEVGAALVRHPLIKAVAFTGSRRGGLALAQLAGQRAVPIPVYAEMGSINPIFMLKGALEKNAEQIADGLSSSVTLGVGQFCTNPGLVVLEKGAAAEKFKARLAEKMLSVAPASMLTPQISRNFQETTAHMASVAGVRKLLMTSPGSVSCGAGPALFAVDAEDWLKNPALHEEAFGPSTLLVECVSSEQMLEVAQALEGQLSAGLFADTTDSQQVTTLIPILETKAGRLVCNGFPTGVEVCNAMVHGGPYPATLDGASTSVGGRALLRFARPVSYQSFPPEFLPNYFKS